MKYYRRIENGYIILIGENCGGIEITEEEYNNILETIRNKPRSEEGCDYKLKEDLTWELYELPIEEGTETDS